MPDLIGLPIAVPPERIVAAAIYHGCTVSLPPPARHGHILAAMSATLGINTPQIPPENQGFLTDTGRYVGRVEAKLIAHRAGQIIRHSAGQHCPELYSEDLWA
jgi:hypothetical protein